MRLRVEFRLLLKPSGSKWSAVVEAPNGETRTVYFLYSSPPLSRQHLGALDQTALTLATAQQLCATQGARLVFVFAPEKFRVFHAFCRFPQKSECRNWIPNDMPARMERAVRSISADIGYLDLTPYLVEAARRGSVPYCPADDRWSREGHQIAAKAINNYLLSTRESVKASGR